ncbi:PAS domain S-box protein [Lentisphaerota bacterium ZTH]|nr:PAS domain S-box protein [Lentisphaerota bacterium]WET05976.1 PAS domain S-box protein [Lentisphaerota bacterium ZTH]
MDRERNRINNLDSSLARAEALLTKAMSTDSGKQELKHACSRLVSAVKNLQQENQKLQREVNERAIAGTHLMAEANKFQAVFNNVYDALLINRLDRKNAEIGSTVEVNKSAVKLLKYCERDLKLLNPHDTFLKHLRFPAFIKKLLHDEQVVIETEIESSLGEKRHCDLRASIFKVGRFEYVVTVIRDIHDSKMTDLQLRSSEMRLQQAQRIAKISGWDYDFNTKRASYASQVKNSIKEIKDDIPGDELQSLFSHIHPDDIDQVMLIWNNISRQNEFEVTYRVITDDGSLLYLFSRGQVQKDKYGNPVKMIGITQDVTEKHIAQEKIKNSEKKLQTFLRSISIGIWEYDIENDSLSFDAELEREFGNGIKFPVSSSEYMTNRVHVQDRERAFNALDKCLNDESGFAESSIRILNSRNQYVWVLSRGVRTSDGKKIVGCFEDLSESIRFDKLKEQFDFLEQIANMIPVPIFYKDLDGTYLGYNNAFAELSRRLIGAEILGQKLPSLFEGENYKVGRRLAKAEKALIRKGSGECIRSYEVTTLDGSKLILVNYKSILKGFDDKPQYIVGVLTDITKIKRVENRLRLTSSRLNMTMNAIREIIMSYDTDLNLQWGNRAARDTFAGKGSRFVGRNWHDIWKRDKKAKNEDSYPVHKILRDKVGYAQDKIKTADGRLYQVWAFPVKGKRGRLAGVVETALDITEHAKAEARAKIHHEQLIQADKMKSLGILVAGVAHEINNPNNFIGINISIIDKIWKDILPVIESYAAENCEFAPGNFPVERLKGAFKDLINGIREGADRIRMIVDSLKGYVREVPAEERNAFDVNRAIDDSVFLLHNLLHKSTFDLRLDKTEQPLLVKGTKQRIEQVIINTLQNACQALTDKHQMISIKSYAIEKKNEVVIEIADEGCGIDKESLKHITDPFFTTKRDKGGTGLGLSISTSILEEHKGRFEMKSTPGRGSVAKIILPRF